MMENKKDSPGVYIPPPLFYVVIFLVAWLLQKKIPINAILFRGHAIKIMGIIFIVIALFFLIKSLRQFIKSKNTVVTMLPASSLQTNGIYQATRNPMYLGLAIVYLGLSCLIGNWWNFILFPFLLLLVQQYIIRNEEKYLDRRFGKEYAEYKRKVRRWL